MSTLISFPGRAGDILWMLPSARAIAEATGAPVALQICGEFRTLLPLLRAQPYLAQVEALDDWPLVPPAEWNPPRLLVGDWDQVLHLGYRGWPQRPLPFEVYEGVASGWMKPIDLTRPWIAVPSLDWCWRLDVTFGFSDCWFELKYGLVELLLREAICSDEEIDPIEEGGALVRTRRAQHDYSFRALGVFPDGSRWVKEAGYKPTDWLQAAREIQHSRVFFGCCSALHVLAVALGRPAVVVEPMVDRHNPIFWPLGMDGPQVRCVKGLDGQPTVDARHVAQALEEALARG